MKVQITYKNGNTITDKAHYVHTEDGKLYYTVAKNSMPVYQSPVIIPLKNIISFNVIMEEGESNG